MLELFSKILNNNNREERTFLDVLCEKSINHFWAREEKKKIRE
jgi:hypothetical protein